MNEISTVEHELTTMVDHDTYKNILDWSSQKAEKVFVETKKKHLKKFADLEHEHGMRVKTRPHETSDNLVVNLSQYKLEDAEKRVLLLGLFHTTLYL